MAVPITLAMLLLVGLCCLLAWLLYQSEARNAALMARYVEDAGMQAKNAVSSAARLTAAQTKQADAMMETVTRGIAEVTAAISESMKAVYLPAQAPQQPTETDYSDLPVPFYAREGSMDFTDPTDAYLGGLNDPGADNHQAAGGNLIVEDGPGGFGLPEGAFDQQVEVR